MASIRRRALFVGVALLASAVSVVAVTGEHEEGPAGRRRPVAVSPEPEAPTAAELERRARALPQPTGGRAARLESPTPLPVSPRR